jgi:hypothetical protein
MKNLAAKPLDPALLRTKYFVKVSVVLGSLFLTPHSYGAMSCTSDPAGFPCEHRHQGIFDRANGREHWSASVDWTEVLGIDRRYTDDSEWHSGFRSRDTYFLSDLAQDYLRSIEQAPGSISRAGQHYWKSGHRELARHRAKPRHHHSSMSWRPPRGNHYSPNEEVPATIPLPAPLGLLAAGSIALFAAARRRR